MLFVLNGSTLWAQENPNYKIKENLYDTDLLTKEFHKGRRDAFRKLMPEASIAVFFANPVRNRNNDVDFEYAQNPDFYYLTGLIEPNAVLVLFKEKTKLDSISSDELIFVQRRDALKETWNGKRLGTAGVKKRLGFDNVLLNTDFEKAGIEFKKAKSILHFQNFKDIRNDEDEKGDLFDLVAHFEKVTEKQNDKKNQALMESIMAKLREVKLPEELSLMRKAISITCEAENELMKAAQPGMTEYQSEAIVEFIFKHRGAEHEGYAAILGSGENSCVLHYETNRKKFEDNDLLLSDVGAEYHGYTADVTRTFPINGKFTPDQKAIYNIVLEAQTAGINASRKDSSFRAPHLAAVKIVAKRLKELGIIKEEAAYRKYFMHGTSHYLGLDVHDVGTYKPLQPGQVITVEPGIYIAEGSDCDPRWWNIGIRIEDDILITNGEPENLSACSPRTIEDIEALMKQKNIFKDFK